MTDGRVSPIASTHCSSWENVSSSQKAYYLCKVRHVFSAVLSTIAPDQEDQVFDALREMIPGCAYQIGQARHQAGFFFFCFVFCLFVFVLFFLFCFFFVLFLHKNNPWTL